MPLNVNREALEKIHGKGQKAEEAFRELVNLGGYGAIGTQQGQINIDYAGGLSVLSALRDENTSIPEKDKDRIAELAGVDRKKDVDNFQSVGLALPADNAATRTEKK